MKTTHMLGLLAAAVTAVVSAETKSDPVLAGMAGRTEAKVRRASDGGNLVCRKPDNLKWLFSQRKPAEVAK